MRLIRCVALITAPLLLAMLGCQNARKVGGSAQADMPAISGLKLSNKNASGNDPVQSQANGPVLVDPSESILSEYTPQAPPSPKPPPYTLLRFNEDYRYLVDSQLQTDPFDPAKYIPLSTEASLRTSTSWNATGIQSAGYSGIVGQIIQSTRRN